VSVSGAWRFTDELRDFIDFVYRPRLTPRLPGRVSGNGVWADWLSLPSWRRLLQWAVFLWVINLVLLGPIAVAAAAAGGAQHRLEIQAIPWLHALIWAPLVEELVFRYGMRRFVQALWLVPVSTVLMVTGPSLTAMLFLCAVLLLAIAPPAWRPAVLRRRRAPGQAWALCRSWQLWFPWIFHLASLAFAAVHLYNFRLSATPLWLLPLLVLPQWLTGLVLGWLRVRRGIGAAILLHATFNAGPLLLVWLILQMLGDLSNF